MCETSTSKVVGGVAESVDFVVNDSAAQPDPKPTDEQTAGKLDLQRNGSVVRIPPAWIDQKRVGEWKFELRTDGQPTDFEPAGPPVNLDGLSEPPAAISKCPPKRMFQANDAEQKGTTQKNRIVRKNAFLQRGEGRGGKRIWGIYSLILLGRTVDIGVPFA